MKTSDCVNKLLESLSDLPTKNITVEVLKERIRKDNVLLKCTQSYITDLMKVLESCSEEDEDIIEYCQERIDINEIGATALSEKLEAEQALLVNMERLQRASEIIKRIEIIHSGDYYDHLSFMWAEVSDEIKSFLAEVEG